MRFVLCHSYSGATLLSALLNQHDKICSLGDMNLREDYWEENRPCSCGEPIQSCKYWTRVVSEINPSISFREHHLLPIHPKILTNQKTNRYLVRSLGFLGLHGPNLLRLFYGKRVEEHVDLYEKFYQLVTKLQGKEYFIDGSKSLVNAIIYACARRNEKHYILHLVRDPRAVFYSTVRHERNISLDNFIKKWVIQNERIAKFGRKHDYMLVRYEDLCNDHKLMQDKIVKFLGIAPSRITKSGHNFGQYHILGNKMILDFDGTVVIDVAWKEKLPLDVQEEIYKKAGKWSEGFEH